MIGLRKWILICLILLFPWQVIFAQALDPITRYEEDSIKREQVAIDRDNRNAELQRELNAELDRFKKLLASTADKESLTKLKENQSILIKFNLSQ